MPRIILSELPGNANEHLLKAVEGSGVNESASSSALWRLFANSWNTGVRGTVNRFRPGVQERAARELLEAHLKEHENLIRDLMTQHGLSEADVRARFAHQIKLTPELEQKMRDALAAGKLRVKGLNLGQAHIEW
jgi:hypothetical protein